jgi:type I restriction enzyme M protein
MPTTLKDIETRLWSVADNLRANSGLRSSEYSTPVLGLIFLKYADQRFAEAQAELEAEYPGEELTADYYQAQGVLYLREAARFSNLLRLPESADMGQAINDAMRAIEEDNEELRDVLPKSYTRIANSTLVSLLRAFNGIPTDIEGDAFGKIYEYFLGEFAKSEGQKGGEFFTPTALVKLIVEVIEPFHGRIYDPACGSGGMFVQSAEFIRRHRQNPTDEISIYGQEKTAETVRLAKMNLAVHGLSGDIMEGNSYYEDLHESTGAFDFVMANPPFNVNGVEKEKLEGDARFPFGLPRPDNGNYLWIQLFLSALNERGRAGFVMANSASDARGSEQEIRRQLLEAGAVDVMIAIGPNMFYTVTLPCTLWFLDRGKGETERADKVLFIDARSIYRQIDRAHRDFTADQIEFLANIVRLYRGETMESAAGSEALTAERFPDGQYQDVPGLCKVATLAEIEAQGCSLNPGRYVGVTARAEDDGDFLERLQELHEEFELLNSEARLLEGQIRQNVNEILERTA